MVPKRQGRVRERRNAAPSCWTSGRFFRNMGTKKREIVFCQEVPNRKFGNAVAPFYPISKLYALYYSFTYPQTRSVWTSDTEKALSLLNTNNKHRLLITQK
jgi:hypothetical protein